MEVMGIEYFFNTHQRVFWLYLLASLIIAMGYIAYRREAITPFLSRDIWWHRSARIDYGYFIVVSIIKALLIMPLIISAKEIALSTAVGLQTLFGYLSPLQWDYNIIMLAFSLSLFVVSDFTRYWLHRLMHTVPLLWRFHRVHHSAEVLNPLTFYRVHPVENILFGVRYALSAGVVSGLFIYCFGARIGLLEIIGVNIFVFVFALMGSNLRHSHIPLRYGAVLERWIISPYMHQTHHTKEGAMHNYGGALAIWDRLFGSLHVSNIKPLNFGLKTGDTHHSVWQLLIEPFTSRKGIKL